MEGYAKVARFMGRHTEFALFRRFRALNMQNLLYLQAEIIHLEADLYKLASEDIRHGKRQNHAHDWWSLSQGESDGDTEQWELMLELREKLEKYSRHLRS